MVDSFIPTSFPQDVVVCGVSVLFQLIIRMKLTGIGVIARGRSGDFGLLADLGLARAWISAGISTSPETILFSSGPLLIWRNVFLFIRL